MEQKYYKEVKNKYLRLFALIIIVIVMVGSIGLIGFSLNFMTEMGFVMHILAESYSFMASSFSLMCGIVAFGLTPIGLYSMMTSKRTMMLVYCVFLFFIIALCVYSAILARYLKNEILSGSMSEWMKISLENEYGHPYGASVDEAWDRMQKEFKCCGISSKNGSEWLSSTWYRSQKNYPISRVPSSCCATCEEIHDRYCFKITEMLDNVASRIDDLLDGSASIDLSPEETICFAASAFCTAAENVVASEEICQGNSLPPDEVPADVFSHSNGCYDVLYENLTSHLHHFMIIDLSFSAFVFVCLVTWVTLCYLEQYESYRAVPITNR